MGTKANPGKFDCYASADENEPIFILRANDPLAPVLVREWCRQYSLKKGFKLTPKQQEKVQEAFQVAGAMEAWKRGKDAARNALREIADKQ